MTPLHAPNYKSKGEVNCARVFTSFVAGWRAIEGKTYEYSIGYHRSVDFYLPEQKLLVEFHPINLNREILNKKLLPSIRDAIRYAPARFKKKVFQALHEEYADQYEKRRKQLCSSSEHPEVRSATLICCFDKRDVFERVVLRVNPTVSYADFCNQWKL
jgi:hypothetical protein